MDKTQKLIVALLIVAILFSVASIFVSFSVSTKYLVPAKGSGYDNGRGQVSLFVEGSGTGGEGNAG